MNKLSLFNRVMLEAPGDPPDISNEETGPPDTPPDISQTSEAPPDMNDEVGAPPDINEGEIGDGPPDMGGEDFAGNEQDDQEFGNDPSEGDNQSEGQPLEFNEKISAIMNMNLYQRFLSLLNNIGGQLSMIKDNSDMLYTLSGESLDIIGSLKKLDENVRLYLTNYFLNENYSKNLLFFNKCLNLLKLLNNIFEKNIQKGIKSME